MPRNILQAAKFNGGMILNADPSDLSDGFGVASLNTMASYDSGTLGGRYKDLPAAPPNDGYVNVEQYGYITKNGIDMKFVHFGDNKIYLDGVESDLDDAKCLTTHQDYALIGRSGAHASYYMNYDGVLCDNIFDATSIYHYVMYTPVIVGGVITSWNTNTHFHISNADRGSFQEDSNYCGPYWQLSNGDNGFSRGSKVRYAFSLVYDGVYHSPLSDPVEFSMDYNGSKIDSGYVQLYCPSMPSIPRVTGINIYRSVVLPGLSGDEGTQYCLLKSIKSNTVSFSFQDANDPATTPFTELSELDEKLTVSTLGYTCAYTMNNFLFVGNVGSNSFLLDNGGRTLYRSIRGKPAQFTIISDYIILPFSPVAITSFNKRLIVFGVASFAVVDPESMTIEEIINGYGITSSLQLYTAPLGLFFANDDNMFVYDGREVIPIGNAVIRSMDSTIDATLDTFGILTYEQVVSGSGGIKRIIYSARSNQILFLYENTAVYAYAFHLDYKTWNLLSFPTLTSAKSAYLDRTNILYFGNLIAMGSSDRMNDYLYITKKYNFGDASQKKKIYVIDLNATNTDKLFRVSFDDADFYPMTDRFVPADKRIQHTAQILFEPNEAHYSPILNGIEIIYRHLANVK
jgi:hypothetical protein